MTGDDSLVLIDEDGFPNLCDDREPGYPELLQ